MKKHTTFSYEWVAVLDCGWQEISVEVPIEGSGGVLES